jgi:valyl-tRNA synthetase
LTSLEVASEVTRPAGSVSFVAGELEAFAVLGDLVDFAAEAKRLDKEIDSAQKQLTSIEKTLANPGFVAKAAPEIIEAKQERKAELEQIIARLTEQRKDVA